ncbi:MAG: Holliday junction branch migration protein RuvA [Actinobacteria bacterium]|nr:Holliday junction branch migration protein RuvA [Actinomycetota bacterium]
MIGSLRGELVERGLDGSVVVEVAGVGYRLQVPPASIPELGEPGADVVLHTHLSVREDALTLYGFPTRDERVCFEALIGAHGVGPAMGLAVLSVHRPDDLRRAVAEGDLGALCLVPGVGRKTAARLLLELKDRLGSTVGSSDAVPEHAGTRVGSAGAEPSPRADVRQALAALGYGPDEVADAVRELPDADDTAVLLKAALAHLGRAR